MSNQRRAHNGSTGIYGPTTEVDGHERGTDDLAARSTELTDEMLREIEKTVE
jgi:hypothetical protein